LEDRRSTSRRGTRGRPARYPFLDRSGEVVLWDRRRSRGRRSVDPGTSWDRHDLPGLLIVTGLFVLLSLGVWALWLYRDVLAAYVGPG